MSLVTGKKGGCGQQVCVGIYIKACIELCLLYNTNHQSNPALCKRERSFSYIMDTTTKVATTAREENTSKIETDIGLNDKQKATITASAKDMHRAGKIVIKACHMLLVLMGFNPKEHVNKISKWIPDRFLWEAVEKFFKLQMADLLRPDFESRYPNDPDGLEKALNFEVGNIWNRKFLAYVKSDAVPVFVQFPRRAKEITQEDFEKMTPEQRLAYTTKQDQAKLNADAKVVTNAVRSMNTARKNNIKLRATGNRQNIDKEAEKKFSAIMRICVEWNEMIENRINNEA